MRTLKIKSGRLGKYDNNLPFMIDDNKLELQVILPNFTGEYYFIADNNGKIIRKLIPENDTVTLENLTAGELKAEIKHYARGELVETYKVEPLILKAVDTQLATMPEIVFLTDEIAALKRELAELGKTVQDNLTATTEGFEVVTKRQDESERALLSFAYAVYENLPLLNAKELSFEQFSETLGMEYIGELPALKEKL